MSLFGLSKIGRIASKNRVAGLAARQVPFGVLVSAVIVALAIGLATPLLGASFSKTVNAAIGVSQGITPSAEAAPAVAEKAWLGIVVGDVDGGAKVLQVMPNSPAAKAGVKKDDIVEAVNGISIVNAKAVATEVQKNKPADQVVLGIKRGNDKLQIAVVAGGDETERGPGHFLGSRRLPPDLQGLEGIPLREMFGHFVGGTFRLKDKDNNDLVINITPGTVVAASATSIRITPNDGGPTREFQVSKDTMLAGANFRAKVEDLKEGNKVVVVAVGSSSRASVIVSVSPSYNPLQDLVPQLRLPKIWPMPDMQQFREWRENFVRPAPLPKS